MCGNEPAISWSRCDSFRLLLNKILPALQFKILHISLSENWLEFYVNRRFYIVETHNERRKTQTTSSAKTIGLVPNQLQDACSIVFLAKNRQQQSEFNCLLFQHFGQKQVPNRTCVRPAFVRSSNM